MAKTQNLSDTQKLSIIKVAESILAEDFTSKPGWNWPASSSQRLVFTMASPDSEGDIEIHIFIKRVESDEDPD